MSSLFKTYTFSSKSLRTTPEKKSFTHCFFVFLPAVIICCHGNTSITHSSFLRKNHFRHCSHVDNISSPAAKHTAFCSRAETWAFNCDHCPFGMTLEPQLLGSLNKNLQNMPVSGKGNNSPHALLLHPTKNLHTEVVSFIQSGHTSYGYSCPNRKISFVFSTQQEKLILLSTGMNLNSSSFAGISWITAFNADQEDWETEFFCTVRLCLHCKQNGRSIPLSTTLSHGRAEVVRTVIRNLHFES